jgi:hypothetical protein
MVDWPLGVSTKVLNNATWEMPPGTIADQTVSGKYKVRSGHAFAPNSLNVTIRMYLAEYRIFEDWYINTTRKGVVSFRFPKITDTTGAMKEYRFRPGSSISLSSPGGLVVDVRMELYEV